MLKNASLYSKHRSMQIHDTEIFLSSIVPKMDWSHQEEDIVMDIGCGPGNSSKQMLLPSFPKVKKMIAVDVLPDMIEFAKKNNASDKIEYYVVNIEDRSTIEKWENQISKVISIYCFNWLDNQEEAFKNIYHLLKPGGEAALLFVLSTPFWDSYKLHFDNPKWKNYLKGANPRIPKSHFEKFGAAYYRNLLGEIGFNIMVCEEEFRTYTYPNEEDCRVAAFSRSGLSNYIPDELKEDFKDDVFQGFLSTNGRDSDGRPMLIYTTLTLLIQKPKI